VQSLGGVLSFIGGKDLQDPERTGREKDATPAGE